VKIDFTFTFYTDDARSNTNQVMKTIYEWKDDT
jgi:hypothetical protein